MGGVLGLDTVWTDVEGSSHVVRDVAGPESHEGLCADGVGVGFTGLTAGDGFLPDLCFDLYRSDNNLIAL